MKLLGLVGLLTVGACTQVTAYGEGAATLRRQQNDLQAKGALAQLCDLSVGAVSRLDEQSRKTVLGQCGLPLQPVYMLTPSQTSPQPLVLSVPPIPQGG